MYKYLKKIIHNLWHNCSVYLVLTKKNFSFHPMGINLAPKTGWDAVLWCFPCFVFLVMSSIELLRYFKGHTDSTTSPWDPHSKRKPGPQEVLLWIGHIAWEGMTFKDSQLLQTLAVWVFPSAIWAKKPSRRTKPWTPLDCSWKRNRDSELPCWVQLTSR